MRWLVFFVSSLWFTTPVNAAEPVASTGAGATVAGAERAGAGTEGCVASAPRARAASDPTGAAGLLADLERIVTSTEANGWFLDEEGFRSAVPVLLESVCRASPAARGQALVSIRARVCSFGDARAVYAAEGDSARFEQALSLDRQQRALEQAIARADRDCPFWVPAQSGFRSRQTDTGRWTVSVETGGNLQLRQTAGRWTFGGGGLGRILPGYGLTEHVSLLFGAEFGGGAMLRPGGEQTEFVINYFPAIPLVLRIRDVNWRYDLEAGPVALFQADNTQLSYGARIGGSIGVFALRTRNVLPWAGVAATYEYYFPGGDRPAAHFVRGGLRVGILWGG
ncbi:MAG: hypothetical protein QM756_34440 [Polyangiaceae bacterium]